MDFQLDSPTTSSGTSGTSGSGGIAGDPNAGSIGTLAQGLLQAQAGVLRPDKEVTIRNGIAGYYDPGDRSQGRQESFQPLTTAQSLTYQNIIQTQNNIQNIASTALDPSTQQNQQVAHATDFPSGLNTGTIVKGTPPTGLMQPAPEAATPVAPIPVTSVPSAPSIPLSISPETPSPVSNLPIGDQETPDNQTPLGTINPSPDTWDMDKSKFHFLGLDFSRGFNPNPLTPITNPQFSQLDYGSPTEAYKAQPATGLMNWQNIEAPKAETINTDYLKEYGISKSKTMDTLPTQVNPVTGLMQTETPADKKARLDKAAYLPEHNTYLKDYKLGWQAYA